VGKKIFLLFVLAFISTGCATTKNPSTLNQLQIQVNQLERKMAATEQEVDELKFLVQNTSASIEDDTNYGLNEAIDDLPAIKASVTQSSSSSEQIIRVAASPQQVQTALKNAGYYTGNIDGKIGSGSQKAIKDFQRDHNLKSDGVIGKNTWNELKNYLE